MLSQYSLRICLSTLSDTLSGCAYRREAKGCGQQLKAALDRLPGLEQLSVCLAVAVEGGTRQDS